MDRSGEPTIKQAVKPYLIFTWGNPSRGDDAIGPEVYKILTADPPPNTDILTDFQLQIEHTEDLLGRKAVIFVDADLSCRPPYEFYPLETEKERSYTTHAMSPQALLSVYQQVNNQSPPAAYMLSIRGYRFELGQPLSTEARQNMGQAIDFFDEPFKTHFV